MIDRRLAETAPGGGAAQTVEAPVVCALTGAVRLAPRAVAKPWGFAEPPPPFAALARRRADDGEAIGEVWFEWPAGVAPPAAEPPLLVKYLFTAEALSVQVHPDDAAARAAGLPRGKEEAWIVVGASPGAQLSLGPQAPLSPDAVRAAIADRTLPDALRRVTPAPGDWFHVPPGTIHAIGGGLTLLEVQQTSDTTYRLYDYGRPRDLHVEAALACADLKPWTARRAPEPIAPGVEVLVRAGAFTLARWTGAEGLAAAPVPPASPLWFLPLAGAGRIGEAAWRAGEAWWLPDARALARLTEAADAAPAHGALAWTPVGPPVG